MNTKLFATAALIAAAVSAPAFAQNTAGNIGSVGAAVNYAFIEHFQDVARAHFTVRRLERAYGKDLVRMEYERLGHAS